MRCTSSQIADQVLTKVAAEPDMSDTAVTAGIVGTGVKLPYWGMLGEKKITQDPYYNKKIPRMSREQLSRIARDGDIIVASRRVRPMPSKGVQSGATGSEFYHAEPVHRSAHPKVRNPTTMAYPESVRGILYDDLVLLRPKKKMTPAQLKMYNAALLEGASKRYGNNVAVQAFLRDIFMPNIKGVTDKLGPIGSKSIQESATCSTVPAMAYERATGSKSVPGKHSKLVLPADFMRDNSAYRAVGASLRNPSARSTTQRLLRRVLLRGALGVGIAGIGLGTREVLRAGSNSGEVHYA